MVNKKNTQTTQEVDTKEVDTSKSEEVTNLQEQLAKLEEKQANLNEGIAGYRKKFKEKDEQVEELKNKLAQLESKDNPVEDLSPEEQKKFDALMKKKGIVTKEELEKFKQVQNRQTIKNVQDQAVDDFIAKHPEYDNDVAWNAVKQEFSLYKTPTTLKGFKKILDKIHKDLSKDNSEEEGANKLRAKLAKKGRLSLGGGSQKTGNEGNIENLQEKYPNLTKAQIKARIDEIKNLGD